MAGVDASALMGALGIVISVELAQLALLAKMLREIHQNRHRSRENEEDIGRLKDHVRSGGRRYFRDGGGED